MLSPASGIPGSLERLPDGMVNLYCDESDDGQTYGLAGWLAQPEEWERFDSAWRAMLQSLGMPDGSPCRAFHAADIVGRDDIRGSPFKGWTFQQEKLAFTRATDVIVSPGICRTLEPLGCAVEIPRSFTWVQRDAVWLLLFMKLFQLLVETFPVNARFNLMFDEKTEIEDHAGQIYKMAKEHFDGRLGSVLAFGCDEKNTPLQAADFMAYEWRKRVSDSTHNPSKPVRTSYARIRQARSGGVLWRYGRRIFDRVLREIDPTTGDQSRAWVDALLYERPTHWD